MQPEIREIELLLDDGKTKRTVTAGVFGFVAVHVAHDERDPASGTRQLTHVPTGLLIRVNLPRDMAIRIAEQIGADPDWDFRDLKQFEQRRAALKRKLDAALEAAAKGGGQKAEH